MRLINRQLPALATATAAALILSGCSADDDSSSGESGGEIPIMVLGSFSEGPYVLPEIPVGAQAAVDRINADGGVNGQRLRLITCDDNANPNDAAACARQAVDEGVAAVVGSFTLFGDSVVPLLERAQIPDILDTAISTTELTSEISFPVQDGSTVTAGLGGAMAANGCQNVATFATDFPQSHSNFQEFWEPAIRDLGADAVTGVYVPAAATDMGPFVAQASSAGSDCLALVTGAQQSASAIVAARASGSSAQMGTTSLGLPESVLGQLGADADGLIAVSTFYLPSTEEPVAVQARDDMAEIDPDQSVNDASLNAYAAVLTFAQAAEGLDEVTGASVIEALNTGGPIDVGLFEPVDFSNGGFLESAPRIAQTVYQVYTAEGGRYVPADQEPVDLRAAFSGG